tara:strand:- start:1157 stop:2146 length:990 start_codon:yes stop_codon:yes gene_type:complete
MVFKTIKKGLNFGKNALVGGLTSRSNRNNNAANSGILRYPYDIMDAETDYFLIEAIKYEAGGTPSFAGGAGAFNKLKGATSERNFILPVPNGIGSKNNIGWQGGNMNALTGAAVGAVREGLDGAIANNGNMLEDIGAGWNAGASYTIDQAAAAGSDTTRLQNYVRSKASAAVVNAIAGSNINANQIMARQDGQIINQNLELLFNSVSLRPFQFRWDIAPRDKKEAKVVKEMFMQLKMRSSPKRVKGDMAFLQSPDVFRISYRKGSSVHPFLNKFKICALTSVGVNYTGSGQYSTYGDTLGTPVHMKLDLAFTELEPIYREDYEEHFIDF